MALGLSLLIAGSTLILLSSSRKKPKKEGKKSSIGKPCRADVSPPKGMICKDGTLYPMIIDESMLDSDRELSNFETIDDEDLSFKDDEEVDIQSEEEGEKESSADKCEEFLQAIHVVPTEEGEISINKIAAEQTAIPTMKKVMIGIYENLGGGMVDADSVGPIMVESALNELVPVCHWSYDEVNFEFTFNDGMRVESDAGRDVIYSLLQISSELIENFNQEKQKDLPSASLQVADSP